MPRRALLTTSAFAVTLAALLGAAAPAQACPRDPAEQQAVTAVASAALDRLEIADDVAASKYLSGKAVADPAREQAVVDATIAAAKADGVDPVAAERIIRAQITASKQVQYALIAFWHANPAQAPTTAPDLTTSVRPAHQRGGCAPRPGHRRRVRRPRRPGVRPPREGRPRPARPGPRRRAPQGLPHGPRDRLHAGVLSRPTDPVGPAAPMR